MKVWKTRSVFWELPYWKFLRTPNSLDIMHITKNVCESLVATIINMPDRTKDGPKARHDLICLGIRKELDGGRTTPDDQEDDDDMSRRRHKAVGRVKSSRRKNITALLLASL